ncbi:MAG: PASTA domain-containing protein, partial [Actinomycetota bacterium]|nr:PASTA domain-containing protein [Actinomycetota bacterium]
LEKADFKVSVKVVSSYLPKGEVIEQAPAPGTTVIPGVGKVHLQVSNGVAPHHTMPYVKGLTLSAAQSMLDAINVFTTVVTKETNDPKQDHIVYGVNPDAGTDIVEGSSATLFVWAAPAPSPSPSPSADPGNGNGNGNGGGGGGPGNGNHVRLVLSSR